MKTGKDEVLGRIHAIDPNFPTPAPIEEEPAAEAFGDFEGALEDDRGPQGVVDDEQVGASEPWDAEGLEITRFGLPGDDESAPGVIEGLEVTGLSPDSEDEEESSEEVGAADDEVDLEDGLGGDDLGVESTVLDGVDDVEDNLAVLGI